MELEDGDGDGMGMGWIATSQQLLALLPRPSSQLVVDKNTQIKGAEWSVHYMYGPNSEDILKGLRVGNR